MVRTARQRCGLSLRQLARAAGTSHSAIAAYEQGRKLPRVDTLERILAAAGWAPQVELARRLDTGAARFAKGSELVEALELAAAFPAPPATQLAYPVFGRIS